MANHEMEEKVMHDIILEGTQADEGERVAEDPASYLNLEGGDAEGAPPSTTGDIVAPTANVNAYSRVLALNEYVHVHAIKFVMFSC